MVDPKMAIWRKKIQEPYFSYIALGIKDVEGRLNRGDWKEMENGDSLIIVSPHGIEIKTEIVRIYSYPTFNDLYRRFGDRLLPNEDPSIYYQWYTPEEEKRYGVIGVVIKKNLVF